MDINTINRRRGMVREQLAAKHIDGLILTRPANVTYLTGFHGEDSWAIVTKNAAYLLTDSRYIEQARQECLRTTVVERRGPIAQAAGTLLGRLKSVRTVAVEKSVSLAVYGDLRKSVKTSLKAVEGLAEAPRAVKDAGEIARVRAAASIAATAFDKALGQIEPGITEIELAGVLELEMRRLGARNCFETIVAFGGNASRPHYQPAPRRLKQRDAILVDFGVRYQGYCCDITRSFAFGKPTATYRKAYEVVEKAQAAAISLARPGVALAQVDAAARNMVRKSGSPVYRYGTGHGLGLEVHEAPMLRPEAKGNLQPGHIITIEPGVYIPGQLGIRLEDDLLITEHGCEVLTHSCPHKLAL